jgi:hypothetical protein
MSARGVPAKGTECWFQQFPDHLCEGRRLTRPPGHKSGDCLAESQRKPGGGHRRPSVLAGLLGQSS